MWLARHAAKQDRLRQAKAEAEKEIAAYKAEREGVYQKKVAEVRATHMHACMHAHGVNTGAQPELMLSQRA